MDFSCKYSQFAVKLPFTHSFALAARAAIIKLKPAIFAAWQNKAHSIVLSAAAAGMR
jgi:hypothetical protein